MLKSTSQSDAEIFLDSLRSARETARLKRLAQTPLQRLEALAESLYPTRDHWDLCPVVLKPSGGWPWVRVVHRRMNDLLMTRHELLTMIGIEPAKFSLLSDYEDLWKQIEVPAAHALRWTVSQFRDAISEETAIREAERQRRIREKEERQALRSARRSA